jgi:TPR repeat protein
MTRQVLKLLAAAAKLADIPKPGFQNLLALAMLQGDARRVPGQPDADTYAQAGELLTSAANAGSAVAAHNLAIMLERRWRAMPSAVRTKPSDIPALVSEWVRKAAAHGLVPAQYNYSVCLSAGYGVSTDIPRVEKLLEQVLASAHAGQVQLDAQNNLACLWLRHGSAARVDEAIQLFTKTAAAGLAAAAYNLGEYYRANYEQFLRDYSVTIEPSILAQLAPKAQFAIQAARCFEDAAKKGLGVAQQAWGRCMLHGIGVRADPKGALLMLLVVGEHDEALRARMVQIISDMTKQGGALSELLGDQLGDDRLKEVFEQIDLDHGGTIDQEELTIALRMLGRSEADIKHMMHSLELVSTGAKPEVNFVQFKELIRAQGNGAAAAAEGRAMYDGSLLPSITGGKLARVAEMEFQQHQLQTKHGNVDAMVDLAHCYKEGHGVMADPRKAFEILKHAANLQQRKAQAEVGRFYLEGIGTKKDPAEGVKWLNIAAKSGYHGACTLLAQCYQKGIGFAQNFHEALRWHQQAANYGSIPALRDLGSMYDAGLGVARNGRKAVELFRRAAAGGDDEAQYILGMKASVGDTRGDGVQSWKEAITWYMKAGRAGHRKALFNLSVIMKRGKGTEVNEREAERLALLSACSHQQTAYICETCLRQLGVLSFVSILAERSEPSKVLSGEEDEGDWIPPYNPNDV